jgi:ABC-2 type transport system ATP-binding protein
MSVTPAPNDQGGSETRPNGTKGEPAIRTAGLSRRYGDVQAVRDLDLVVPAGSVFGFLGRNGAGKTTTIRLITGLARPDAGRAWIGGVASSDGDGRAAPLFGYLPQEPAFYGWLTAAETLDHAGRLFRIPAAERRQRVDELLRLVDLAGAARRRVGGFSGGMKQRLGLAAALIHRPQVLILDEPMAGLDPAGRREALDLLDALREHVTVFFSSHILADVERVCDTVGILHEGRLVEVAGRAELLARYTTNVAVIEARAEAAGQLPALAAMLESQPWVSGVTVDGAMLRVTAADAGAGQSALLPLVAGHNLPILRVEWTRPDLEAIFLSRTGEGTS